MRIARAVLIPAARWWASLSRREHVLLAALAAALVLAAAHAGVVRPLRAIGAEARAGIAAHETALARLAAAPPAPVPEPRDASDAPATALLAETAAEAGLTILRIEPEANGARLVLADAPFESVVGWIDRVERETGLALAHAEIERRPEPGMIGADLGFGRR